MLNFVSFSTDFELSRFRVFVHSYESALARFHQSQLELKYFCHYTDHLHNDLPSYYCFPRVASTFFASCSCDCLELEPLLFPQLVVIHQVSLENGQSL